MKARSVFLLLTGFLIIGFLVGAGFLIAQNPSFKSKVLFNKFKKQPLEKLTSNQKVILLSGYCRLGEINRAMSIYSDLVDDISKLSKYERLSIANHYGRLLRETGHGVEELNLYGDLLRNDYPAYYHLFLAQAYSKRGEFSKRRGELTLAYRDARRSNDEETLRVVEKLFKEVTTT